MSSGERWCACDVESSWAIVVQPLINFFHFYILFCFNRRTPGSQADRMAAVHKIHKDGTQRCQVPVANVSYHRRTSPVVSDLVNHYERQSGNKIYGTHSPLITTPSVKVARQLVSNIILINSTLQGVVVAGRTG